MGAVEDDSPRTRPSGHLPDAQRSDSLFQKVIELPVPIETSGVDFQGDEKFKARVAAVFHALCVANAQAAYDVLNADKSYDPSRFMATKRKGMKL